MTTQPAPQPPPSPEGLARLRAENAALSEQLANQALREAAGSLPGGGGGQRPGNVSVLKNPDGHVVVTTPEGRTFTYDPAVGLDEDAIQEAVQTALEPPRPPADAWEQGPPESVAIVAIVFTSLLLMTLMLSLARVFGRRGAARAGAQAPPAELMARMARIEQAVEAVAIEVERISESERYSARLLTERLPERAPAAPNGQGAATAPAGAGPAAATRDAPR
jgi:hypothetical protein